MTTEKTTGRLLERLQAARPSLLELDAYYAGKQPLAFLSKASREALDTSMRSLAVNYPRLAVSSLSERLDVTGFRPADQEQADPALWALWRRSRMVEASAQAHLDALVYGRSYVIVWAGRDGSPQITVESPLQMLVEHDPATREVVAAVKRWKDQDGMARVVLFEADKITHMSGPRVVDDAAFPARGFETTSVLNNPLGAVPVVQVTNRARLLDVDGVSAMRDILGLVDLLNKVMSDAAVGSEHFSRPRRWATGIERWEEEDGDLADMFNDDPGAMWLVENADARFGQFPGSGLNGYADLVKVITQQIGALSGLPPHYVGVASTQPTSSEAIHAAEASLVSRADELTRSFGAAWSDVMALAVAVRDGSDPRAEDLVTLWGSTSTRTPASQADAAAKLAGIGVPLETLLADQLGYTPDQVAGVMNASRRNAVLQAGSNLDALL